MERACMVQSLHGLAWPRQGEVTPDKSRWLGRLFESENQTQYTLPRWMLDRLSSHIARSWICICIAPVRKCGSVGMW